MRRFAAVLVLLSLITECNADRVVLQVEEFDGPWRRQTNIAGYIGDSFCTSNANPEIASSVMRGTVEIQEPGRHAVWVRAYTSDNSPRALQVAVADTRLETTHKGTRRQWAWEKSGEVDLSAGTVEIVVHDADVGFETADAVLLTDDLDEDPQAGERLWSVFPDGFPDDANALTFNIDACVAAAQAIPDVKDSENWNVRRVDVERAFRRALGFEQWPQKSPLQTQITGRSDCGDYAIENVLFQSFPHFYVTANVYVPKSAPRPLPAIVVTAGHAMQQGKNYDPYRTAQLGLVQRGFLVIAYDPIGQGERQLPGYSHPVSYAALLTGKSNLHYMTWDSMRAVDYLLTRDDVDAKRIGLTGNSGGGLNTMYTMPIEPRFAAGASYCCLCSYQAWLADGGNHCICNHLPGACTKFEQFEFVGLCSPRPFLAGNGAQDPIFPIEGVRNTIDRARAIYALDNAADRIQLAEAPLPHGWSQPLREVAYGWFDQWLQARGDGSPIPEPEIALEPWQSEPLQVLKSGAMPDDAKSYVDLVREEATRLIAGYPPAPQDSAARAAWADALRQSLWEILGSRPEGFSPSAESLGQFVWTGRAQYSVDRLAIHTEKNLKIPALMIRPQGVSDRVPVVVMLDDDGKDAIRHRKCCQELLLRGCAILALDVRGLGEIKVHENHCASDAIVLGRPMLAQQAWDVLCAVETLRARRDILTDRIAIYGRGSTGLIAILAAALSPDPAAVVAQNVIGSFQHAIADPLPQPLWTYAPNILKTADIPELVALSAPTAFLWVNPVGENRDRLTQTQVDHLLSRTSSQANAQTCLQAAPDEQIIQFLTSQLVLPNITD